MKNVFRYLTSSFFKGLLVVIPIVLTGYIIYAIIRLIDQMMPIHNTILGLAIALTGITAIGVFAGNVVGRRFFRTFEKIIKRVPIVKLFYTSIRDLLAAFIGDQRTFENPVLIDIDKQGGASLLGFVTCETFDDPQLKEHVAVYMPQSYNFAGNILVVHRSRIRPIDAVPSEFMAFIMSGGVAKMNAARTMFHSKPPLPPH